MEKIQIEVNHIASCDALPSLFLMLEGMADSDDEVLRAAVYRRVGQIAYRAIFSSDLAQERFSEAQELGIAIFEAHH